MIVTIPINEWVGKIAHIEIKGKAYKGRIFCIDDKRYGCNPIGISFKQMSYYCEPTEVLKITEN